MRSLSEIRKSRLQQKGIELLFVGMEEKPTAINKELVKEQREFFDEVLKPIRNSVLERQIENGHL